MASDRKQEKFDASVAKVGARGWLDEVKRRAPQSTRVAILEAELRNAKKKA